MNNISTLFDDPQVALIQDIEKSIAQYSLKETIDCEISAIELRKDKLSDDSEEFKDLEFVHGAFEALAKLAENLSEDAKTGLGCRQIRRRARDRFLIDIADIKVN